MHDMQSNGAAQAGSTIGREHAACPCQAENMQSYGAAQRGAACWEGSTKHALEEQRTCSLMEQCKVGQHDERAHVKKISLRSR